MSNGTLVSSEVSAPLPPHNLALMGAFERIDSGTGFKDSASCYCDETGEPGYSDYSDYTDCPADD